MIKIIIEYDNNKEEAEKILNEMFDNDLSCSIIECCADECNCSISTRGCKECEKYVKEKYIELRKVK